MSDNKKNTILWGGLIFVYIMNIFMLLNMRTNTIDDNEALYQKGIRDQAVGKKVVMAEISRGLKILRYVQSNSLAPEVGK